VSYILWAARAVWFSYVGCTASFNFFFGLASSGVRASMVAQVRSTSKICSSTSEGGLIGCRALTC